MRFAAVVLILVACSPAPVPVARDGRDPSNPSAPEGVDPVAAVHTARTTASSAAVWACPMHPEVVSDHEDRCPKCGMTLVPKR